MSDHRTVISPAGWPSGSHVCWGFHGEGDLSAAATACVNDGIRRGEQVAYWGRGDSAELLADLERVDRVEQYVDRGQLALTDIETLPGSDSSQHPARELKTVANLTHRALADGYTGLRIVADATCRVSDPERREEYVYYEHLIDLFCLSNPLTRMCAFDADLIGGDALSDLAIVHSLKHGSTVPLQLRASVATDFALSGSVDHFSVDRLVRALRRILQHTDDDAVVIDVRDLSFVDHNALLTIDAFAEEQGTTLVLRSAPRSVDRLATLLDLRRIKVEAG